MAVPTPQSHKPRKDYTDVTPVTVKKISFIKKRRVEIPKGTYFGLNNRDANTKGVS